jgi:ABC-type lipoprotein release transport system permease subunit
MKNELADLKAHIVRQKPEADLIVQQKGVKDKLTARLPEKLTAKISAIPGVREVNTGLVDLISLEGADPVGILVQGWPADQPVLKKIDLVQGRRLAAGDTDGVMLGSSLAEKLGKKIGDELTLFDEAPTFRIVGIYRGQSVFQDGSAIVLLGSLQKWMKAMGFVSAFTVLLEHPDKPENVERIKKEIEKLGKDVEVTFPHEIVLWRQ